MVVDDDLCEAMEFERSHSADEIDEFRQRQFDAMLIMVAKLDGRRQRVAHGDPARDLWCCQIAPWALRRSPRGVVGVS